MLLNFQVPKILAIQVNHSLSTIHTEKQDSVSPPYLCLLSTAPLKRAEFLQPTLKIPQVPCLKRRAIGTNGFIIFSFQLCRFLPAPSPRWWPMYDFIDMIYATSLILILGSITRLTIQGLCARAVGQMFRLVRREWLAFE